MDNSELAKFINWMEEQCDNLKEGESFSLSKEVINFDLVKKFKIAYNSTNTKAKIAVDCKSNEIVIIKIPEGVNAVIFQKMLGCEKQSSKKDCVQESRERVEKSIAAFFSGNYPESYNSGIKDVDELRRKEVIPFRFMYLYTCSSSCFKKAAEKKGQSKVLYLRTIIQDLVDERILFPMTTFDAKEEFNTEAELYIKVAE